MSEILVSESKNKLTVFGSDSEGKWKSECTPDGSNGSFKCSGIGVDNSGALFGITSKIHHDHKIETLHEEWRMSVDGKVVVSGIDEYAKQKSKSKGNSR